MDKKEKVKWLIISDCHIFNQYSQVDKLISVLEKYDFEKLFLVGDIFDFYPRKLNFTKKEIKALRKFLKILKDKQVIYLVGNHELFLSDFVGEELGNLKIKQEHIEEDTLFVHGHIFDLCSKISFLWKLGDVFYQLLIRMNKLYIKICNILNIQYKFTLSQYIKRKVKHAINFINKFESIASDYAKQKGVSNIICGHIHHSENKEINGIHYLNCGDFLEDSSYITLSYSNQFKVNSVD